MKKTYIHTNLQYVMTKISNLEKIDIMITKSWLNTHNSIKSDILTKAHHILVRCGAKGLYTQQNHMILFLMELKGLYRQ